MDFLALIPSVVIIVTVVVPIPAVIARLAHPRRGVASAIPTPASIALLLLGVLLTAVVLIICPIASPTTSTPLTIILIPLHRRSRIPC